MNLPGGWELILVVLVIMVLFGAKRLPDASRSLGRSMRILKAETKGLRDSDTADGDLAGPEPVVEHLPRRDTVSGSDGGGPVGGSGTGDPTRPR